MEYFQVQAILSGNRTKTAINKSESDVLTEFVIPFKSKGTISIQWGKKTHSYQVLELRIYKTRELYDKKTGKTLEEFVKKSKNCFYTFDKKADKILQTTSYPVFIIMPIQGDKYGGQDEQRIFKEYDSRFQKIEEAVQEFNCTAIRIDKEYPLEELVKRIKFEIDKCIFTIADLTDERPSCYYEAGYAEAKNKPIIFISSKESVVNPKTKTNIHFDIHRNVLFFSNHDEMIEKIKGTIEKNRSRLFQKEETPVLEI